MADRHQMGEFWDARAREDAMYFVDDRMRYGAADQETFWAGGHEAVELILGELGVSLSGHETVVEIGCGIGRITRALATRAARVLALDVSEQMLARAREHNPDLATVSWLLGSGSDLTGIADGEADACFSHVVFQHIPDPAITLGYVREMGRVLTPGGWSAFGVSNLPAVHRPRARRLRDAVAAGSGAPPGAPAIHAGLAPRSTWTSWRPPPPRAAWGWSGSSARGHSSAWCCCGGPARP